ncbi:sushi, nidogen and EGF-like domain-containing protein [Pimephales promelas]|nr:sushi, nidogen and EGF-like domain-containing protein [Pimephales promelas]
MTHSPSPRRHPPRRVLQKLQNFVWNKRCTWHWLAPHARQKKIALVCDEGPAGAPAETNHPADFEEALGARPTQSGGPRVGRIDAAALSLETVSRVHSMEVGKFSQVSHPPAESAFSVWSSTRHEMPFACRSAACSLPLHVAQVNNNGQITFTEPLYAYSPLLKSEIDIIAPLWTDLDNRHEGTISYRVDTSSAVLAQVTAAVKEYSPNITFAATCAFIATWDRVPYYRGGGVVTFQVVLAYNVHRSFILFNYGDIATTTQSWTAGYRTMDSVNSFIIPLTKARELSTKSNINVPGKWSFRTDGSPNLPTRFLALENEQILNPFAGNGSSGAIFLQQPFKYFGYTYSQIFVNNNGHLTFTEPLPAYNSSLDSGRDIIAPLWTRLDNRRGGTISYKEDTSSPVLTQVTAAVKRFFPNIPFAATSAFVATWDSVPYSNGGGVASFQVVLAYNVHRSFILIYYGDVAETGQTWRAGYYTVDFVSSFTIPASSVRELSTSSNVNVTACWSFHVDGSPNSNFLPFGNGELVTPRLDNGSSEAIILQQPLKYFGHTHNQTFVNNNGLLTFTEQLSDNIPLLNCGRDFIAPLWTHLDNRRGGTISYREDTSSAVLAQVTAAVKQYFPNITFSASSAFVATWDNVPYSNGGGVVSFQTVLVSSVHRTFILISYGNIAETKQIWLAGYNTADSVNSFTIPVTNASELSSSSNVNVNGRSSFHVDGSPKLPTSFLPSGVGEIVIPTAVDGSSDVIFLQTPFKYFGRTYNQIFVNNNGHLTFTEPLPAYNSSLHSGRDIIAPLWTRLDNRRGGTISYRQETSSAALTQVTAAVKRYFPNIPFAATSAFVATWDSVPYSNGGGVASFQVVLAYNVHRSFILIYYGDVAETGQPWQAGYYTVDSISSFTIPASSVPELSSSSNVNVTACWSFHVDGSPNLPSNFLPFGNGELVTPRLDNGSSEAIILQQPLKYFGRTHNQTFVNNNGLLTFTEQLSDNIPLLNCGRDFIAPLWTHLDNRRGGTISYREDTSSAVLAQVTAAVKQYFPNITFSASSAFVATWDNVPYSNGGGVVSFQTVLVSSVHRTFILINYGNIAETEQIWLAGYNTADSVNSFTIPVTNASELSSSSNVNVNGRSSFHVDGSPKLPTSFLPSGVGEIVIPTADDGSSDVIFLQTPFKYFGRTYNQIFVNNNGHLTFTQPLPAYNSSLDSGRDIIAPLWTRLDNRRGGTISYRQETSSAALTQVTAAVKRYFPNIPFAATSAFVATWDSVPYSNGGGVVSFQTVLVSSVHRTFILINYGNIAETEQIWLAGYNTADSVNSFTIPVTNASELSSSSNVNVNGRSSFHVDGSPKLPTSFLPSGVGEIVIPTADDGSSDVIFLQTPFKYFGRTYNQIFVNNNGHLTFTEPLPAYNSSLHSGRDIIAPLWTRLDNRRGGTISYRQETSSAALTQVTAAVKRYFPNIPFAATSAFVATWDSVPYSNGGGVASFQVVLAYNVHRSFILIYYGDVAETGLSWQVNNNGLLTFTEQLSDNIPLLNCGRDFIAPLWTHLDNRRGGTISYREDTSSAVLAQVTAAVKQYFPNITFSASSAFVATWDNVPYSNGGGVVSFQTVLVSSVHRTFILINYGNIAETKQIWLAGYNTADSLNSFTIPVTNASELSSSSNINVNGRSSFHVDGSPKLPTSFLPSEVGEIVIPTADDGSSDVIFLQTPFKYFGRTYNQIFVNNNGHLTFTEPLPAYNSSLDSRRDIIAPLWTRLDNRRGGTISYRQETSSAALTQVTAAVKRYFPNIPFAATSAFVATWDSVPYSNGGGVASFQVVLAYNVHRSFILIYYGDVAQTGQPWQAGYYTVDSISSFTIPASSVPELSSSSNVNVTACWSFHVDGSPNCKPTICVTGYDKVNNNGLLTFTEQLSENIPLLNCGRDFIAPLWTHLDNRRGGTISYREDTSSAVLAQVTAAVKQYFPNITFSASSAFVATWDNVPYSNGGGVVSFQTVLVSSVHRTFILINYGNIAETKQIWLAGYNTADSANSFTIPVTNASELSSSSNVKVNGRSSFHVDGSPNLPTSFLPSEVGEIVIPTADDGSSDVIFLQKPFKYFGRTYNQIFVNNNGHLTFTEPLPAYNSSLHSGRDIIAPLWTRLDNRRGGTISYRQETSSAALTQVTAAVKRYFPNIPFAATSAFVATWDSVPYSNGGGVASFQVVLAYNVHRSFILIYYGDISETGQPWQAGYYTVDSISSFTIPASSVPELSSSSNVNVTACWSFHVDGSPNLPSNFLPFGNGELVTPRLDNGSSEAIILQQPLKYFGRTHNQTFVNNNGLLTFTEQLSDNIPLLNCGRDFIAPLWTHLDNRRGGTISYREDTSSAVLAQVTAAVKQYFPNITFSASSAFVATWDNVPYSNGGGVVSFQTVLVSSVHRTFILINYGNIAETEQIWLAGYNTADSVNSFTIPVTNASELSSSSNVNVNGRSSFHVDGSPKFPTSFLPSGVGEIVIPTADDGSSVIFLQTPFKYFGRTYNQIFVNNNGHLTFTEPLPAYNSSLDPGRDIIAPLWTHLDYRRGGTISYRQETSSAALTQVTAAVKRYFPNIPFAATSAFVATWDSVPYSNGGGVASFQVVLAYNVHRSFILIYYGDVAETGLPWQAGYYTVDSISSFTIPASSVPELSSSSNVNVTACWSFHVDGSPNCKPTSCVTGSHSGNFELRVNAVGTPLRDES